MSLSDKHCGGFAVMMTCCDSGFFLGSKQNKASKQQVMSPSPAQSNSRTFWRQQGEGQAEAWLHLLTVGSSTVTVGGISSRLAWSAYPAWLSHHLTQHLWSKILASWTSAGSFSGIKIKRPAHHTVCTENTAIYSHCDSHHSTFHLWGG